MDFSTVLILILSIQQSVTNFFRNFQGYDVWCGFNLFEVNKNCLCYEYLLKLF